MNRIEEIRTRLTAIRTELRGVLDAGKAAGKTDLDAESTKKWDALVAEKRGLSAELDRLLELEPDAVEQRAAAPAQGSERRAAADPDPDPVDAEGTPRRPRRAPAGIGSRGKDRAYSLITLFRAMKSGDHRQADVERRASDQIAEILNREPEGYFVPHRMLFTHEERMALAKKDVELREILKTGSGANLVGVDLIPQEFIEILRNESVAARLGARMIPDLDGDVDIPRQTGATAGAWLATETATLTADATFATSKASLTPKTVGIRQDISRKMLKQSTPAIEALVIEDIRAQIGLAVDLAVMAGTAAGGQPRGITQTSGVGSVDATGGLTWADCVEFETDVAAANALRGRLAFAMRGSVAGALKTTLRASGVSGYLMADDGTVNGYPVLRSENVPASTIIFGNWAEALVGLWGGLDLFGDQVTLGDRGGLVVRGFQDCDVAIRHAGSFSVCINVP